jgi:hypothetical protein
MTEKPLPEIAEILEQYPGLLWHHCPDSRGCIGSPGMPDVIIVGPGGVSWREVKPPGGHPHAGQIDWKYTLIAAGQDWGVWGPADVDNGQVLIRANALSRIPAVRVSGKCRCTCSNCVGCLS